MRDTIFLQFYNPVKDNYYDLCNGFSDAYDLCAGKGDFLWYEHEADSTKWYDERTYQDPDMPVDSGTVYISAVYLNHLYQAVVWAGRYPNIQFVVGGPAAAERGIGSDGWNPVYFQLNQGASLPPNLKITGISVEDWFGVPNFSGKWRLKLPDEIPPKNPIYFSYTLDNRCYWQKCIYCNIALHAKETFRKRTDFQFEFKEIPHPGRKLVRLNTGSMTPRYIRELLPNLPDEDDLEYRLFMRPATPENNALSWAIKKRKGPFPKMTLGLGIEFPSDRMLAHVGKGFDQKEMLQSLQLCKENGLRVNGNFILGWNNLIKSDIQELADFVEQVPAGAMATLQVRWLFAHPYTDIHQTYQGDPIRLGPFYLGFRTLIPEDQLVLNREACEIVEQFSRDKGCKLEGMPSIYRYLKQS